MEICQIMARVWRMQQENNLLKARGPNKLGRTYVSKHDTDEMKTKAGVHTIICVYMCVFLSFPSLVFICLQASCIKPSKDFQSTNVPSHTHIPSPWVNQILFSLFLFLLHPLLANRTMYLCLPELAAIGLAVHETLPRGVGLVDHLLNGV